MKVLLISPPDIPIRPESRYIGIERMVWSYSQELVKDHKVTVLGNSNSIYPDGVNLLGIYPKRNPELESFQSYQYLIRDYDVVHDWSHLHLASRYMPNLPSLNLFSCPCFSQIS
jgi:hypothetical protein